MATLTGQTIATSYEQLLHVDRDGGGNGANHVNIKDGDNGTTFGFTIATDALMMTSTNRLEFGDTGTYIHQSADGVLDLVSDTEVEINGALIDINSTGAMTLDAADDSNITVAGSNKDLSIAVSGGSTQTLTISSAGTGANAIGLNASAGGITVGLGGGAGDDFIVDTNTLVVESDNNRVGIGTTEPDDLLHIKGTGVIRSTIESSNNDAELRLNSYSGTGETGSCFIYFDSSSSASTHEGMIRYNHSSVAANQNMKFYAGDGTLAMTILGSGNVGIGEASPGKRLEVDEPNADADSAGVATVSKFRGGADDGGGTVYYITCEDGNGDDVGYIQSINANFTTPQASDRRIKKDIVDTSRTGLSAIKSLQVRDFKYKKNNIQATGLIAQEVKEVWEDVISGEPDAVKENGSVKPMAVAYSHLVIPLILAVQELSAKVEALENAN